MLYLTPPSSDMCQSVPGQYGGPVRLPICHVLSSQELPVLCQHWLTSMTRFHPFHLPSGLGPRGWMKTSWINKHCWWAHGIWWALDNKVSHFPFFFFFPQFTFSYLLYYQVTMALMSFELYHFVSGYNNKRQCHLLRFYAPGKENTTFPWMWMNSLYGFQNLDGRHLRSAFLFLFGTLNSGSTTSKNPVRPITFRGHLIRK